MSYDGLIPQPSERSPVSRTVIGLFLLCTAGAGLWDGIAPPATAQVAGREGERLQQERADSLVRDGTWMRMVDADLARRSNFKDRLDPWYAALLLRGFDEASNEVHVGSHGWLFLKARAGRPAVHAADLASTWARAFASMDRQFKRRGGRLLVMPVPRRAVACQAFLPAGVQPDFGFEDALHDALQAEGIDRVDLRGGFRALPPEDLWYREDTHWNRKAQWLAAQTARRAHGSLAGFDAWSDQLHEMESGRDLQGLLRFLNVEPDSMAREWLLPRDSSPALLPLDPTLRQADGPADAPLALIGTSFSVGEGFLAYLRLQGTTDVRNVARRGFRIGSGIGRYAMLHKQPHETILVEAPLHQLLPRENARRSPVFDLGELEFLTAIHGASGPTLTRPSDWTLDASVRSGACLVLPAHRILTTGDGVASVRLERPAGATTPWRVRMQVGELQWTANWSGTRPVLHMPILDLDGAAGEIRITVTGADSTALETSHARIVMEHDLSNSTTLVAPPAQHQDHVRVREFAWPSDWTPAAGAALRYRQGAWRARVRIELIPRDGSVATVVASATLHELGQAVLDLGAHSDHDWSGVRITTSPLTSGESTDGPSPFHGRDRADSLALIPLQAL